MAEVKWGGCNTSGRLQEQSAGDTERERRAWRKAREQHLAAKRAQREALVRGFVQDLAECALRIADFRERAGTNMPQKEYNDLLALLRAGDPSLCVSGEGHASADTAEDAIAAAALRDFLESAGEWASDEAVGFNEALGDAAQAVRLAADPPPTAGPAALKVPVRIAVVGAPFSGKSTLARELAAAYGATVLEPEGLVAAAVEAATAYVEPAPQVCSKYWLVRDPGVSQLVFA